MNPYLNAVVEDRFEEALTDAKEVDKRLAEFRKSGKLHNLETKYPFLGVPFTVKESCSLSGTSPFYLPLS